MNNLLKLLESLERRKPVGTLVLGRRGRCCELFIEEDRVHFAGKEFSGKVDIDGLAKAGVLGTRVSLGILDTAIANSNLSQKPLPEILYGQGIIGPEERGVLLTSHHREEIFARVILHGESFGFQDDQVPAQLLGDDPRKAPIPLRDVIELIRSRTEAMTVIEGMIPSRKEVLVLTEKGMAHGNGPEGDIVERKIFSLIDGFRDLSQILRDVPFFEYPVIARVAAALEAGHLKKTVLPEIREVNVSTLAPEEAKKVLPAFKAAVKYAVDEIGVRERLALIYERMGENDEAVIQYNFIGDALYRMRKTAKALKAYGRGLELRPSNPLVSDKVIKIYGEAAEEACAAGKREEAIGHLRSALKVRPDAKAAFERLLTLHLEAGEVRQSSELCDAAISRSRAHRDIGPGLRALQMASARFPREPAFKKKLINLYIDFGMDGEAAAELEALARRELEHGQTARAQEILEKVVRIDPGRDDIRRELRRLERRDAARKLPHSRVPILKLTLTAGILILGYQVWAYASLLRLRGEGDLLRGVAHGQSTAPQTEGILPGEREKGLRDLAGRANSFATRFPYTLAAIEARRIGRSQGEEARRLADTRERRKEAILEAGTRLQSDGRMDEAIAQLRKLDVAEDGDRWKRQGREAIARIEAYERDAAELKRQAAESETAGDIAGAYGRLHRILNEYPLSKAGRALELPVEVRMIPETGVLKVEGSDPVPTPGKVRVRPGRPVQVDAEADGFERLREKISVEGGPSRTLFLNRQPRWIAALGSPMRHAPVIVGDLVLSVTEDGTLWALAIGDGSVLWSRSSGTVVAPVAPPVGLEGRVFLALNDGQILRLGPKGEADLRVKPKGLIAGGLIASPPGQVIFGMGSGSLISWNLASDRPAWTAPIKITPARIEAGGEGRILVSSEKGKVCAVDRNDGTVLWEASIDGLIQGAVEVGEAAIVRTGEGQVVALDARSGKIIWRRSVATPDRAAVIRERGTVVFLVEDEGAAELLVEVEPRTGKAVARGPVPAPIASILDAPGGIGAVLSDGRFIQLAAGSFRPVWGWKHSGGRVMAASGDGEWVFLTTDSGGIAAFAR